MYEPSAEELAAFLPSVSLGLTNALQRLWEHPTPGAVTTAATQLQGALHFIAKLRLAIDREATPI